MYKGVKAKYDALKAKHGAPRAEHGALKAKHGALRAEHNALKAEHNALRAEHNALRAEHDVETFGVAGSGSGSGSVRPDGAGARAAVDRIAAEAAVEGDTGSRGEWGGLVSAEDKMRCLKAELEASRLQRRDSRRQKATKRRRKQYAEAGGEVV